MRDALMLIGALFVCICGMAWLSLAMEPHWRQVRGQAPVSRRITVVLRVLGSAALLVSLVLCLNADHVSMASLVWVMSLAASAMVVAFTLTWRPRALAWLVAWVKS
jgi:hypothetical protein